MIIQEPKTPTSTRQSLRLIESDDFPFEFLSRVGERESWRKEIYRPIYHLHKWWAKRLGSVFRGILLGSLLPPDADLTEAFYSSQTFPDAVVLDPFMGSGTTIGEAHKLGCSALGRDINQVACESVRVSLGPLVRSDLQRAYERVYSEVGERILDLYSAKDHDGRPCDVLYYFWVKYIPCPDCNSRVDLFASRILARNAYPKRKPEVQVCCPGCGEIIPALTSDTNLNCPSCRISFDPRVGSANGARATCPACSRSFSILDVVRTTSEPPAHRLYAKLVLASNGDKRYLRATDHDVRSYQACSELLKTELEHNRLVLPDTILEPGHNTQQALNYNYHAWRDFFNDRQLLALGWLQRSISRESDSATRDALFLLFSGVLEFNNMFASYKGEGTGAVRHMFSHHILKPERMPIEASVWGTPKSSGSFSTLFKLRLQRALDYRDMPFEVGKAGAGKSFSISQPMRGHVEDHWPVETELRSGGIYLSCGSSHETLMPAGCADLIVTDPPFFDNVHYSELADFFLAWQRLYPHGFIDGSETTRHADEVQDTSNCAFTEKLKSVFQECHRLLTDSGLLVFTYHHSRPDGWNALAEAVVTSGFRFVIAHPVRSEMISATPKSQSRQPIQLDVILVCRKQNVLVHPLVDEKEAIIKAESQMIRLERAGLRLSENDRQVVLSSQRMVARGSDAMPTPRKPE